MLNSLRSLWNKNDAEICFILQGWQRFKSIGKNMGRWEFSHTIGVQIHTNLAILSEVNEKHTNRIGGYVHQWEPQGDIS